MRNQPSASNASCVLIGVEVADAHFGPAHEQLAVGDAQLDRADRATVVGVARRLPRRCRVLVATVGASVDPYVRFTTAPNRCDASSTNATLTPAPPLDTSRRLATRSAAKPGACISPTKNVGGPTMNVTRSRSMSSSATSGSQRAMNTVRNGTTPGQRDAVQQSRDVRGGRGHEHAVVDARARARRAMSVALYASVACVCSTPFGTPLDPDVNSTAASCSRSVHTSVTGGPSGERVEIVDDEPADRRPRRARSTSAAPELMVERRRDRAEPPTGAVQERDLVAVVRLPRDRVAGFHAECTQTAGDPSHRDPRARRQRRA